MPAPPDRSLWEELAQRVVDCLVAKPAAVLAFGSRALGFALPESDYDLYIIGPDHAQGPETRRTAAERIAVDLSVQVNLHGCSPGYAHLYRTFDPQLNAALRGGQVIRGDASPWVPCPKLSATGTRDVCASVRVLLEEADLPGILAHAWKQLLLATALLSEPPAWPEYYREARETVSRERVADALRRLEGLGSRLPDTDEDGRLLALARR